MMDDDNKRLGGVDGRQAELEFQPMIPGEVEGRMAMPEALVSVANAQPHVANVQPMLVKNNAQSTAGKSTPLACILMVVMNVVKIAAGCACIGGGVALVLAVVLQAQSAGATSSDVGLSAVVERPNQLQKSTSKTPTWLPYQ